MSRGKWDCIRPGYLTLRQEFRLDNHWKGYLTGGNFSDDRQGLAAGIGYFSSDGRWTVRRRRWYNRFVSFIWQRLGNE